MGDSGDTMDTAVRDVWELCPRNQGGAMVCLARRTDVNAGNDCQQEQFCRRGTLPRARTMGCSRVGGAFMSE